MSSTDWIPSLWMNTFSEMLDDDNELDYGDTWTLKFNYSLTRDLTPEERKRGWKIYYPCAHGQFSCGSCDNTWTSAKVMVLFHYRLQRGRGTVIMRPFSQACRRCQSNLYNRPGFSKEQVEHVLLRLFSKIKKNCYREESEDNSCDASPKRWTKPHESSLCEACQQGICCEVDD